MELSEQNVTMKMCANLPPPVKPKKIMTLQESNSVTSQEGSYKIIKKPVYTKNIAFESRNNLITLKYYAVLVCVCVSMLWNAECMEAFIDVAKTGDVDMLGKYLAIPGINVNIKNDNGDTALIVASFCGHIDVVKWLLDDENRESKIDVNIRSDTGYTALMIASLRGKTEVVECLLDDENRETKIDVNIKNNDG